MSDTTIATLRPSPGLPSTNSSVDILASAASFEHMQRVAKVFCASALIPEHLKKNNGADALLALQIAKRMNEDPVSVMQNIYFVSGKAGWSASYMIARANRSGVFKGPIRWKTTGEGENMAVTARGRLAEIAPPEDVEVTVSMKMAKAEGWTKNSKYNTMAEHMLRWRSATMLIRLYCPEVMMGMPTDDELTDERHASSFRDITGEGHASTAEQVGNILAGASAQQATEGGQADGAVHDAVNGEILDPEPKGKEEAEPAPQFDTFKTFSGFNDFSLDFLPKTSPAHAKAWHDFYGEKLAGFMSSAEKGVKEKAENLIGLYSRAILPAEAAE